MDHWGNAWADDADDTAVSKTPTKAEAVAPTFAPAPVILNGFLDDASWGSNDDDGFGAWATSPRKPEYEGTTLETRVGGLGTLSTWNDLPEPEEHGLEIQDGGEAFPESAQWDRAAHDAETPKEPDREISETSDSGTTIQPDDAPTPVATELAPSVQADDDLSTRPSTSPSDISRNENAAESPRTSFEEERAAEKAVEAEPKPTIQSASGQEKEREDAVTEAMSLPSEEVDDDFGDFEDEEGQELVEPRLQAAAIQGPLPSPSWGTANEPTGPVQENKVEPSSHQAPTSIGSYTLERDLLAQLFPPEKRPKVVEEAPHDPIHSTSARKAWYRLMRKQTMREFNSGNDDDDYIRVTWKTSHVRSEVNKIVGKWASEDRIAGRGPGARASFYWDSTPSDAETTMHPRKKTSISVSNPARPAKQSMQPLSTNVPAAFNWSSPSTATEPLKQATPGLRSTSSPSAMKHSSIAKLQRQEGRAVSVDLTSRPKEPTGHKRIATASDIVNEVVHAPPKPAVQPTRPQADANPWANLSALDTTSPPPPKTEPLAAASATVEDDDDWGEMVESPAVSTHTPIQTPISTTAPTASFSEPSTRNNTLSTPSTTPKSVRSSPLQPLPLPAGSKHASPIVRLKGTVSPTSAIFKANAFVPASVEQGPIGPDILKRRIGSREGTPEKHRQVETIEEVLGSAPPNVKVQEEEARRSSSMDIPIPATPHETGTPTISTTPPPSSPSLPQTSDPDFSIFESSLPTHPSAHLPPSDPIGPWSIFETPAPTSTPSPPPAHPFARPPPKPTTPPPKQPLTSATNSAQKRKEEEDEMIRSIVEALPDLGYMLRR